MHGVAVGDRVKLSKKAMRGMRRKTHGTVDWRTRRGTVAHLTVYTGDAGILWDGRKSRDIWPITALIVIEDKADAVCQ